MKAPSKKNRKQDDLNAILNLPTTGKHITLPEVTKLLDNNYSRAQMLLRELTVTNQLIKWGRGVMARWTIVEPQTIAAETK